MAWAAPPQDYEGYLPEEVARPRTLSHLTPEVRERPAFDFLLAKAKQQRLIVVLLLLPFFLFFAGMIAVTSGIWQISVLIMGLWAALTLLLISFWFHAFVVFGLY